MEQSSLAAAGDGARGSGAVAYPDLVQLNTNRTLLDSLGRELLERTFAEHLGILQTAVTVFEANGDYATGLRPMGWCAAMDDLSRPPVDAAEARGAIDTGEWSCRSSCRRPALEAMARRVPVDWDCPAGLCIHAVPILGGGTVVGSISIGLGGPPTEPRALAALANDLGTTVEQLQQRASAAKPSSPDANAIACASVDALARLLGEMVSRRTDERERDRARGMSIGMLAHDLRNSISAIMAGTAVLGKLADQQAPGAQITARVQRSARSMSRMLEDLLDFARASRGEGIHLDLERVDLGVLCADAIDEVRLANPARAIGFDVAGDTVLECDAERLRRLLQNLLLNAIRHGQGSSVDATVVGSPDGVQIRVHNDGKPIPADALPTLFEAFAQVNGSGTQDAPEGLGLGLHIAREIVRAHGGSIEVTSTEANGTIFTVNLPRHAVPSTRVEPDSSHDKQS